MESRLYGVESALLFVLGGFYLLRSRGLYFPLRGAKPINIFVTSGS